MRVCTSAPPSSSAVTSSPVAAFTSGGPPRKIVPVPLTITVSSRHRGDVRAAGRARTHHRRDLRDAACRHARLIVEDAAEVIAIGKDFVLHRQERAAGIDEIDARQTVLLGDLLRAQMLLDGERVVGAAFDGRVVGDDHAVPPLDHADAGDDARRGRRVGVDAVGGQRREFQKRRERIAQPVDALARRAASRGCDGVPSPLRRRRRALCASRRATRRPLSRIAASLR